MVELLVLHRVDHGNLVGVTADVGEQLGKLRARLAVLAELERRAFEPGRLLLHERELGPIGERFGQRLAVEAVHLGLVIEEINMAWPAPHEEENALLRLGRKMARFGRERIAVCCPGVGALRRPTDLRRPEGQQQPRQKCHASLAKALSAASSNRPIPNGP